MVQVDLKLVKACVMGGGEITELLRSYKLKDVCEIPAGLELRELKQLLKGTDVVIGGYGYGEQREVAGAASELGIPFITYPVITTILPDGISFDAIEFPDSQTQTRSPLLNMIARALQLVEMLRLFSGVGELLFAPKALVLYLDVGSQDLRLKSVELRLKDNKDDSDDVA
ncbi:MAG: hypothetical protein N2V76_04705 [Methanophagales archaeon]|nr:hypothetical protein [Methanophagales archaeon]MCW3137714.1 hypothetical protein [Methanophagales archaeon]